ncbi:MAG: phage holin family protein [Maioricimonas sp. JB045]|uniref:phage holin family protein n=1 Tax=Maioricimonas sp. JC845 TaxID=3232138 RepID=UPI003458479D
MLEFLAHLLVTSILLLVVANFVRGVVIENWSSAIVTALLLGIVNAIIRPLIVLLTLPLTILTFGLFLLVINALMLQLAAALSPGVKVEGCGAALLGSLMLSILNLLVGIVAGGLG